jgi:DNA-binding CsgD family transcriptional regulator
MLGRRAEQVRIERLLAEARAGGCGVLVLRGDAGIGKTTLLAHAQERASRMRVLAARGVEPETGIPFGGLLELLRPVTHALDRIPPPQASALRAALGIAAAGPGDRFLVGAATLSLLAAAAEDEPLAILIDDFQWLDRPSAEAIVFAARRVFADPIALIATVRDGEPSAFDGVPLPEHVLHGLDRDDVFELLRGLTHRDPAADTVDRMIAATGGNPLAVVELSGRLEELAGDGARGPIPVSTRVGGAFLRRMDPLSDEARTALLVAAVSDTGGLAEVSQACRSLGIDAALRLEEAETSGLVRITATAVEFRHPLARSTCYAAATPAARRAAHRALAAHTVADRRAWHLAQGAVGPDEAAAAALAEAADRASAQHAYSAAAAAAERAGGLTARGNIRASRLLAAAEAAFLAGETARALALVIEVEDGEAHEDVRVALDELCGRITLRRGPIPAGIAILLPAARVAADRDPARAVEMLADCVLACAYTGDAIGILEPGRLVREIAVRNGDLRSRIVATAVEGAALAYAAHGALGPARIREALALFSDAEELHDDLEVLVWLMIATLFLREGAIGEELCGAALDAVRKRGAVAFLPRVLAFTARDAATRDKWSAGVALYREALAAAAETGHDAERAWTLAALASLQARQGLEEDARANADEAIALSHRLGAAGNLYWATGALADVELGRGDFERAIVQLERREQSLRAAGNADPDLSMAPELVEAYARSGLPEDAVRAFAEYAQAASDKGQPWALARYHRACGLLADEAGIDEAFGAALEQHALAPDAFEAARTRLCYGERLRRARRRVDARAELRRAFAVFDRLGAAPWRERAAQELAATGETARRRDISTLDDLTPQELSIATLLASGRTTREAAATLFVSPKTVEHHLRHAYQKLGVRNRAELALALAPKASDEGPVRT